MAGTGAAAALTTSAGLLRVATVGSVDDGKSTLVGRLLYDAKAVLADTLEAVTTGSRESVGKGRGSVDLSLLVDGLRAEQEQGITIDVAHRYLATPRRNIHLVDCPGHVEYTRNTVTGASLADVALLLVDARNGLVEQTRRHTAVLGLLRVQHLVVAVNKIDLVGYDESRFTEIADAVRAYAGELGLLDEIGVTAAPLSALEGDNVSERSPHTPWYSGPPLLGLLETLPIAPQPGVALRLPVQWVAPGQVDDARGPRVAGSVTAGVLQDGQEVLVLPSGRRARVRDLTGPAGPLDVAGEEAAVSLRLEGLNSPDSPDSPGSLNSPDSVARGAVLVPADDPPQVARAVFADVAVTDDREIRAGERLRVRLASSEVCGTVEEVLDRLDVSTGRRETANGLELNDIGRVRLSFDEPLPVDPYALHRSTGGLLLLDEESGDVRAGVLVREILEADPQKAA